MGCINSTPVEDAQQSSKSNCNDSSRGNQNRSHDLTRRDRNRTSRLSLAMTAPAAAAAAAAAVQPPQVPPQHFSLSASPGPPQPSPNSDGFIDPTAIFGHSGETSTADFSQTTDTLRLSGLIRRRSGQSSSARLKQMSTDEQHYQKQQQQHMQIPGVWEVVAAAGEALNARNEGFNNENSDTIKSKKSRKNKSGKLGTRRLELWLDGVEPEKVPVVYKQNGNHFATKDGDEGARYMTSSVSSDPHELLLAEIAGRNNKNINKNYSSSLSNADGSDHTNNNRNHDNPRSIINKQQNSSCSNQTNESGRRSSNNSGNNNTDPTRRLTQDVLDLNEVQITQYEEEERKESLLGYSLQQQEEMQQQQPRIMNEARDLDPNVVVLVASPAAMHHQIDSSTHDSSNHATSLNDLKLSTDIAGKENVLLLSTSLVGSRIADQ